jgi:hypothetical protein
LDRNEVVIQARRYLRTRFALHGRTKGRAIDCLGIVLCVGEDLGLCYSNSTPIRSKDYSDYGSFSKLETSETEADRVFIRKPIAAILPGDILVLKPPFSVQHWGIVSQLPQGLGIIHAYSTLGKCAEHLLDWRWKSRIRAAFSYPGVDN